MYSLVDIFVLGTSGSTGWLININIVWGQKKTLSQLRKIKLSFRIVKNEPKGYYQKKIDT